MTGTGLVLRGFSIDLISRTMDQRRLKTVSRSRAFATGRKIRLFQVHGQRHCPSQSPLLLERLDGCMKRYRVVPATVCVFCQVRTAPILASMMKELRCQKRSCLGPSPLLQSSSY